MEMKLCRFTHQDQEVRVGLLANETTVLDLTAAGCAGLSPLLESDDLPGAVRAQAGAAPKIPLAEVSLRAPVDRQEVWAAGVTYMRSKHARMEESDFSASAYDLVYDAERPEIFFKAFPEKVVGPGEAVGIRRDGKWNVPEPELALVMNSRGDIVGCSLGNDMSSRDIEGANLLYLPQAKVYNRSCALGPWLVLGADEPTVRRWSISMQIRRAGEVVFEGATSFSQLKRSFAELRDFLFRCQTYAHGVVLFTGTGVVPGDDFTLAAGDQVAIHCPEIGRLENPVVVV